jgi:bifunctional DNase/RNase
MFASYRSLLDGRYCTFEIRFFISVEYNEFQCEEIVFKTGNIANMPIYRAIENKKKIEMAVNTFQLGARKNLIQMSSDVITAVTVIIKLLTIKI